MQVIPLEGEALGIVECLVNELALPLINDVVVANELLVPLGLGHLVRLVGDAAGNQSVTDTNESFLNEVHLVHLLVLVVDYVVVQVVLESSGQEPLRYLEQQADVLLLVALGIVEKAPERRYHVFEQIIDSNFDLDFIRHIMQIRAGVTVEELVAVISLIVIEVTLDTLLQGLSQGLPVVESLQAKYPVIEFLAAVRVSHLNLVLLNNLADLVHNN